MGPSGSRKTICLIVYPVFFLLAVGACLLATAIPLRRISKINIVDSIEKRCSYNEKKV